MSGILHVIGLMSGSSLDGLDMAFCRFEFEDDLRAAPRWSLLKAETASFSAAWQQRLRELPRVSGLELIQADADFGHYMGELLQPFLAGLPHPPDLIASHGHTIFHYPDRGFTLQIGDGAALAAETGCAIANHFRSMDIAYGGQGAPLAPLADRYLFPGYDFYLNLGGIANISARAGERFVAFDISGANQVLNALVQPLGLKYDENGSLAASGRLSAGLLEEADGFDYFKKPYPKSLGNDWVQEQLLPVYLNHAAAIPDKLHTACIQLARQTADSIAEIIRREGLNQPVFNLLVTGGGAHNGFLVRCIREACEKICSLVVTVPAPEVIDYKEAALMALMGALRLAGRPNCMSSATGARADVIGGAVWLPVL